MAATAAMVARLRRMIAEPTTTTYSDSDLDDWIESYPVADGDYNDPTDADWTATYDLHAAASELWSEKAAAVAADFSFSADGGNYSRDQVYAQYMKQTRFHSARRRAGSVRIHSDAGGRDTDAWIGNLSEENS